MLSMSGIDFEGIARVALAQSRSLLKEWLPEGEWHGREFRVGNIYGAPGASLSINGDTGAWADFGGDERGGDLTSLYAAINRLSQADAARALSEKLHLQNEQKSAIVVTLKPKEPEPGKDWIPILPVPADAPHPPAAHFKHGSPTHVARYLNREGALLGYVYRCEPPNERKQVPSLTFCEHVNGRRDWRWQSLPKPRSLYGAELLNQTGTILVVEGEPKCDAARRLVGDALIVVSWSGGCKAAAHADWSLLAGRDVVIWPDADRVGKDAAAQIVIQLRHYGTDARVVEPPADAPEGWDLADAEREGWSARDVMAVIYPPEPPHQDHYEPAPDTEHSDFVPLGHDRGRFYFFTSGGGQVRDFSSRDLQSIGYLCELAPLRFWEMNYPGKGEAGFNARSAGDNLVRACYRAGIYDAERLRGRGAWLDEGRTVLHLGDRLIVDGVEISLADMRSRYIYEQGRRMSLAIADEQLPSKRASQLIKLCESAPWEDGPSMGRLLAGWLVIAPVCGAMPWRPHIWVTGEAGSGKTWIIDNIVRLVVGDIALQVASKTSEAGVRGDLGLDARPVIFDEFESQNEADRGRVQQVLDLARQASSEDGAAIVKGTQTGGSRRYRVRSCFVFSSINLGLQQAADESRTVVLTAAPDPDQTTRRANFSRLVELQKEILTPDFRPALLARTLALLPIIWANAEVFAAAIARSGKSRRTGDTIGVLLAGAWSLHSRTIATADQADNFVETREWVRQAVGRSDSDPEWQRALDYLVQIPLRVSTGNRPVAQDIPIGELIHLIAKTPNHPVASTEDAASVLARAGIKVDTKEEKLVVANSSEPLRRAFNLTPWSSSWLATLARTPGSGKLEKPARFGSFTSRGLCIPLSQVFRD
jgi:putative DNA primase/helicase